MPENNNGGGPVGMYVGFSFAHVAVWLLLAVVFYFVTRRMATATSAVTAVFMACFFLVGMFLSVLAVVLLGSESGPRVEFREPVFALYVFFGLLFSMIWIIEKWLFGVPWRSALAVSAFMSSAWLLVVEILLATERLKR